MDAREEGGSTMAAQGPIILTLMVRDEVDIIAAMIEHHLAQGVDHIIVTDNASVDGTREILAKYEKLGVLELHDDPRHEKQQSEVVTKMARRAAEELGASWVINADADEFWVAADRTRTLAEVLRELPDDIQSLRIPVKNVLASATEKGPVLGGLRWRDERDEEALRAVGLHAQPTPNMLVRGVPGLEIAQGNHFSNLPVTEEAPERLGVEVLHVPFRSWERYETRVVNTGEGYLASPHLKPSPRHHGMRDYRWLKAGVLEPFYVARFPAPDDTKPAGFVEDTWLTEHLTELVKTAKLPDELKKLLVKPAAFPNEATLRAAHAELGPGFGGIESTWAGDMTGMQAAVDQLIQQRDEHVMQIEGMRYAEGLLRAENDELKSRVESLTAALELTRKNLEQMQGYTARAMGDRSVRLGLAAGNVIRRVRGIVRGKP